MFAALVLIVVYDFAIRAWNLYSNIHVIRHVPTMLQNAFSV